MANKRRLPVLQSRADEGDPVRPPWQWALFATLLTVAAWMPLAMIASPLAGSPVEGDAERWQVRAATLQGAALALAAFAAGGVTGRFSARSGVAAAAVGGALAPAFVLVLTVARDGASPFELVALVVGTAFAAAGARTFRRREPRL